MPDLLWHEALIGDAPTNLIFFVVTSVILVCFLIVQYTIREGRD